MLWDVVMYTLKRPTISENTLASKCMDQYMKITGTLYLQNVLGKIIKQIYKENKYCEMDKSRITKKYG